MSTKKKPSGILGRVVSKKLADVSEASTASIIRMMSDRKLYLFDYGEDN
jgi:hypothetical protein